MRKTQETKLSEIFTLYLASAAARGVKDKTLRTYEQHFNAISKRLDVDSNISLITSKDLDIMNNKALVVIDLQNDITKNYKEIIETTNQAIDWAAANNMNVVYIRHHNLSAGTRTFKPDTRGAEFVPELKIVSDHIFTKTKSNALTSE